MQGAGPQSARKDGSNVLFHGNSLAGLAAGLLLTVRPAAAQEGDVLQASNNTYIRHQNSAEYLRRVRSAMTTLPARTRRSGLHRVRGQVRFT